MAEDGVKLHGWYVPCPGSKTAVLFFHGNAGNLSDRIDNVVRLHRSVGVDVFIMDYRGYGKSEGRPDEAGLCRDGTAAMDELRRRIDGADKKIALFGRSLGGAVAIDVAARMTCDALIVESTFKSIPAVASALMPIIPPAMIKTKFDSINKIRKVAVPKLFIHGERDSLIPFKQGRELYEKAAEPKEFYAIPGADHNDTYLVGGEVYFDKWTEFIRRIESA